MNLMERVNKTLEDYPERASLYTFIAEEPTMSATRVEAMCTGSHPPFYKLPENLKPNKVIAVYSVYSTLKIRSLKIIF
jgi:predicted AlkP superfamily pyrophosphatase or phosphodiesterase